MWSTPADEDLPGLAMALAGDAATAARLLVQSGARRRGRPAEWQQLLREGARGTTPTVRRRSPLPADLESVAEQLDTLLPRDRAILVGVRLLRLTQAEVAGVLDRPVAAVASAIRELPGALGDPHEVAAALDALTAQPPDPADLAAARRQLGRRRRRRRRLVALAGSLTVAALVLAVVVPWQRDRSRSWPVYERGAGELVYVIDVEVPLRWYRTAHLVGPEVEEIRLVHDERDHDGPGTGAFGSCAVRVNLGPAPTDDPDDRVGRLEPVSVQGHQGTFVRSRQAGGGVVTWPIGPAATGVVQCADTTDDKALALEFARATRIDRGSSVPLPFRLSRLPGGARIGWVGELAGRPHLALETVTPARAEDTTITLYREGDDAGTEPLRHDQRGGWSFEDITNGVIACREIEHRRLCVEDLTMRPDRGNSHNEATYQRVLGITHDLSIASAISDPGTWFDARDALPH